MKWLIEEMYPPSTAAELGRLGHDAVGVAGSALVGSSDDELYELAAAEGRVVVVRSGEWWAITVPSLRGVFSQARQIDEVPAAAREAIALMLDVDPAEVGPIDVHVQEQDGAELLAE